MSNTNLHRKINIHQSMTLELKDAEISRSRAESLIPELAKAVRSLKTEDVNPNCASIPASQLANGNWSARTNLALVAETDPNRQYELVARAVERAESPEGALAVIKKAVIWRKTDFQDCASVVHLSEQAAKRIAEITGYAPTE